ncbi:MAG: thioredoxin family protein [Opitutales bacterium]|nr:thioredoxin family protein [Opitutales bacterium]
MKRLFSIFALFALAQSCVAAGAVKFSALPLPYGGGPKFEVLLKFSIPEGAHIYGKAPEFGAPTEFAFSMPDGFKLKNLKWPKEQKFSFMGSEFSGYGGDVEILAELSCAGKAAGEKTFAVEARWLACSDTCEPRSARAEFKVDFGAGKTENSPVAPFAAILAAAFLGGLILNLMPCVFPVIGLKILSFAKSSGGKDALIGAGFYTLGIVASFLSLAGILLGLRAAGESLGWGFQLQNPAFAAAMALLFFAVGLSFAGVFKIGAGFAGGAALGGAKSKWLESALSGILAVLVASPCTAPFMGGALGAAFAAEMPAGKSLLIFAFLGLGMASPYVAFAAAPRLGALLPKPGAWMEKLEKILSLPMFATAAWLGWLYWRQTGNISHIAGAAVLLGIGLAVYGKFSMPHFSALARRLSLFAAVASAALALAIVSLPSGEGGAKKSNSENAWSAEKVAELRKKGFPVYVDFTADWCLTCRYNEQILRSEKIKKLFAEKSVKVLVGDWTTRDGRITAELEKFGRAGVPLNILYPPRGEPIVLPAILGESALIDAVDKIK